MGLPSFDDFEEPQRSADEDGFMPGSFGQQAARARALAFPWVTEISGS